MSLIQVKGKMLDMSTLQTVLRSRNRLTYIIIASQQTGRAYKSYSTKESSFTSRGLQRNQESEEDERVAISVIYILSTYSSSAANTTKRKHVDVNRILFIFQIKALLVWMRRDYLLVPPTGGHEDHGPHPRARCYTSFARSQMTGANGDGPTKVPLGVGTLHHHNSISHVNHQRDRRRKLLLVRDLTTH